MIFQLFFLQKSSFHSIPPQLLVLIQRYQGEFWLQNVANVVEIQRIDPSSMRSEKFYLDSK